MSDFTTYKSEKREISKKVVEIEKAVNGYILRTSDKTYIASNEQELHRYVGKFVMDAIGMAEKERIASINITAETI